MSESFQFGAPVKEPEPLPAPPMVVARDRRPKLLALAGAGLLALAVAAYLLLFSGGDEPVASSGPGVAAPAPDVVETPAPVNSGTDPIRAASFGRDPFKPLIRDAGASDTATGAGGTTSSSTGTGSTSGSTGSGSTGAGTTSSGISAPVTPDPVSAPDPVSTSDPGSTPDPVTPDPVATTEPTKILPLPSTPHRFKVVRVSKDNKTIVVEMDGQTFKHLHAGEVFGKKRFKVVMIGEEISSFRYRAEAFMVMGRKTVTIA